MNCCLGDHVHRNSIHHHIAVLLSVVFRLFGLLDRFDGRLIVLLELSFELRNDRFLSVFYVVNVAVVVNVKPTKVQVYDCSGWQELLHGWVEVRHRLLNLSEGRGSVHGSGQFQTQGHKGQLLGTGQFFGLALAEGVYVEI